MKFRPFATWLVVSLLAALGILQQAEASRPNIILIFMDDLGYNDIGAQTYPDPPNQYPVSGPAPNHPYTDPDLPAPNQAQNLTPSIDSLASQGLTMTSFYATRLCSPSRASLMCGRYERRVNISRVFFPAIGQNLTGGLSTREVTLPESLREAGYATGMVGKWHLGYKPARPIPFQFMPTRHGFQEFFGSPHSNNQDDFDLIRDETVLEPDFATPDEQAQITWRYTEAALDFIQRKSAGDDPFFLFFSHAMTHVPCWPSDRTFTNADGTIWPKFEGTSGVSYYYDVVKEVDHSTGRILTKLDELGIADDTLVIFTSDNGPWINLETYNVSNLKDPDLVDFSVGSAYPLKEGKFTTWEGGVRVPFLARWPAQIPAGSVTDQPGGLVDLLPTLVGLGEGTVPTDRTIDGIDLWPVWSGSVGSIDRYYAVHFDDNVEGVIKGQWKLRDGTQLYDLVNDIQERTDVAGISANATILAELQAERTAIDTSLDTDNEPRGEFTDWEVELSGNDLGVPEGGTATFDVRLSANPGASVTVTTARFSGDSDLSVSAGGSLSFTTGNWSDWQTVTLSAAQDADDVSGGATFRVTNSVHNTVREVFALEEDDEAAAPVTSSLVWPKIDGPGLSDDSVKLVAEGTALVGGTPDPAGTTYQWTKVSGPGTVSFTDANAAETGVSFSSDGAYLLRLMADHPAAGGSGVAEFTAYVGVAPPGGGEPDFSPLLAYDATADTDGDSVWENVATAGVRDWQLAANVTRTTSDPAPSLPWLDAAWVFPGQGGGGMSAGDIIVVDLGKIGQETTGNWNNVSREAPGDNLFGENEILVGDLVRFSDGTATGVGLVAPATDTDSPADGISGQMGIGGLSAATVGASASFTGVGTIPDNAQIDVSFVNDGDWSLVFTGLDGSLSYNLEIMSWTGTNPRNAHNIVVNGTSISVDPDSTNYVYAFSGLSANGSDEIVISFPDAGGGADLQHINAIELTAASGGTTAAGATSPSFDAEGAGNASIEIWFKPDALPLASPQVLWETGGDAGASLTIDGSVLNFAVDDGGGDVALGAVASATLAPLAGNDGFIHCVGTIDLTADQIRLFLDGSLADTQAIPSVVDWCGVSQTGLGTIADSSGVETADTGHLGGNDLLSGGFDTFAGMVARTNFYERALTDSEIAQLADPSGTGPNIGPGVSAGTDQMVAFSAGATLAGSASDDGLPAPGVLTTAWVDVVAPGNVSFGDPAQPATTAGFDAAGDYDLWLVADDGEIKVYDDLSITVLPLTYGEWIADPAFGLDLEDRGFELDPDGDGNANGLESYFGTNPGAAGPRGLAAVAMSGNTFSFTHPLNDPLPSDVSATYRWSEDLSTYHADGADNGQGTSVSFSPGPPSGGMVTVTANITGPVPDRLFVILAVSHNP